MYNTGKNMGLKLADGQKPLVCIAMKQNSKNEQIKNHTEASQACL